MDALTLLIIRHAEKPDGAFPGPGLTDQGDKDKESLVIRGWQRAGAWAALFGAGLGGSDYPAPGIVYAATPASGQSQRPFETALPLSARLGPAPDVGFGKGQEAALMAEVLQQSGVVLISWEHKAVIADILPKIPVASGRPPADWPEDRFDVVLRFDRPAGGTAFAFRELFPKLLSGDSDAPLG
jgi:hypothetical protein